MEASDCGRPLVEQCTGWHQHKRRKPQLGDCSEGNPRLAAASRHRDDSTPPGHLPGCERCELVVAQVRCPQLHRRSVPGVRAPRKLELRGKLAVTKRWGPQLLDSRVPQHARQPRQLLRISVQQDRATVKSYRDGVCSHAPESRHLACQFFASLFRRVRRGLAPAFPVTGPEPDGIRIC